MEMTVEKTEVRMLKDMPEDELGFIPAVIKKSLAVLESSWDMTYVGALMLGIASKGNPGMALYMLSVIDPQPNAVITHKDVAAHFPLGFQGDWDATWDKFRVEDESQRAVFLR